MAKAQSSPLEGLGLRGHAQSPSRSGATKGSLAICFLHTFCVLFPHPTESSTAGLHIRLHPPVVLYPLHRNAKGALLLFSTAPAETEEQG